MPIPDRGFNKASMFARKQYPEVWLLCCKRLIGLGYAIARAGRTDLFAMIATAQVLQLIYSNQDCVIFNFSITCVTC
jgi:hypothetical protein